MTVPPGNVRGPAEPIQAQGALAARVGRAARDASRRSRSATRGPGAVARDYAIAVLAVGTATALSWLLRTGLVPNPFLLFFPAVAVAAWAGGAGPGLLAAALSVISADYLFLAPIGTFQLDWREDSLRLLAFFLVSTLVAALTGSLSRARREAEARAAEARRYADELEQQGMELEQQMEASQALLEQLEEQRAELEAANAVAEGLADRHAHLHRIAAALSSAGTPDRIAHVVLEEGMDAKEAAGGAVLLLDPERAEFRTLAQAGVPRAVRGRYARFPLRPGGPVSDAVLEDRPVMVESVEAAEAAGYHDLADALRASGHGSAAIVPVPVEGRALGALTFIFPRPRAFADTAVTFMRTLAGLCGAALERASLYERAEAARAAAEEANRAKAQFLTVMSHELRTPLNAITGYTQLLELGVHGPTTDQQRRSLERIHASARLQLHLINQVLSFAKIEAGHLEPVAEPTRLLPLLEEMGELVRPQIEDLHQAYTLDPCPSGLVLSTDGEKLRQILLNLLSNAVKFTPAGGDIRVRCDVGTDGVHVHVDDSGPGIPPEDRDRVFEPFVQLGRDLTSTHAGTGLGLSISRDLARLLGGEIEATERPDGPGARFTLSIPLAPPAAASS